MRNEARLEFKYIASELSNILFNRQTTSLFDAGSAQTDYVTVCVCVRKTHLLQNGTNRYCVSICEMYVFIISIVKPATV